MIQPIHKAIAILSLLIVLAVAGCGDSSPTKAELIEEGDIACRTIEEKKAAGLEAFILKIARADKPITAGQKEIQVKQVLAPPIREGIEELREIGAPSGEEEKVESMLDDMERALEEDEKEAEEAAQGAKRNKPASLAGYKDPYRAPSEDFEKYGFKTCFINY